MSSSGSSWWVRAPRSGGPSRSATLLLALPHAGGGPAAFRDWSRDLPAHVELAIALLPGRERRIREAPPRRIETIVEGLLGALRGELDRPLAILGHSFGGLVGFELARAIERESARTPLRLFASGCRAPHAREGVRELHRLEGDAFVDAVRELGGTPDEVLAHRELLELVLPVLRADLEACETYRCARIEPIGAPITAIGARDDASVPPFALEAWRDATRAAFDVQWLDGGGHFFLERRRADVLARVAAALAPASFSTATPRPGAR